MNLRPWRFSFGRIAISLLAVLIAAQLSAVSPARAQSAAGPANLPVKPAASPKAPGVGERVPSDDPVIPDLHSIGLINGRIDIFRSACPVRDLASAMTTNPPNPEALAPARARMQHLYDLGIRTVISFEVPGTDAESKTSLGGKNATVILERAAATAVGITFVNHPISNSGPASLENMSDQAVIDLLEPISREIFADADRGGVLYHCSAGHDRTGIMTAYMRIRYQHWPVDQAVDEMRRFGHNWPKYSSNGGVSSWHEDHLRAIATMLQNGTITLPPLAAPAPHQP